MSMDHRITHADLTREEIPVIFQGKKHNVGALKTCLGEELFQATHIAMIMIGSEETAAYRHYQKVSNRCRSLCHGNISPADHLQVNQP